MQQMNKNGEDVGFEEGLLKAMDKLRGNMEPSDYKQVVLGLIFLKHISDSFDARRSELLAEHPEEVEDRDAYNAKNIFWVSQKARWSNIRDSAKKAGIGRRIDDAMRAIEKDNPSLKGVLPRDYAHPFLNSAMLGSLIDVISKISMNGVKSHDLLVRAYEYFLVQFADFEGRRGGELFTPHSVVRTMVEMLEPRMGRVYDPCCGSGGMFVQSKKFVEAHNGCVGDIAIYGQENNHTIWQLCRMNLAIRGIDADIRWNSAGSFHKNEFSNMRFDYILADPPFSVFDWGGDSLRDDPRWEYGTPPRSNANFAWLQHVLYHLKSSGTAGVVLANGSMSSTHLEKSEIRKKMIEKDVVDCIVSLPGQLFYSTQIPACLWFFARDKKDRGRFRDRRGEFLFIDAQKFGVMVDRTHREFTDENISKIVNAYHCWREGRGDYADVPGFCKSVLLEEIKKNDYMLMPRRYVGAEAVEDDGIPFEDRFARLRKTLAVQFATADELSVLIKKKLGSVAPDE